MNIFRQAVAQLRVHRIETIFFGSDFHAESETNETRAWQTPLLIGSFARHNCFFS